MSTHQNGTHWLPANPPWPLVPAGALFRNRSEHSRVSDVHLTPSQSHGVIPQSDYVKITGNRVVLNLTGANNMKHVESGDFIIHLRSFQGGLEYSPIEGKVSNAYTVLHPSSLAHAPFFRYMLKSSAFIAGLASLTDQLRDGQNITHSKFALLRLPLPDLPTQRRIGEYLDRETAQIDSMARGLDRLLERLKERRQAIITNFLFDGSARHSEEITKTAPLWSALTETDSRADHQQATLPLLSVSKNRGAVRHSILFPEREARATTLINYKIVEKNDVILNKMSASSGAVGISSEKGITSPDYAVFRIAPENEPRYFHHLLRSDWLLSQIAVSLRGIGTSDSQNVRTPRVSIRDYLSFRAPLPDLHAQRHIANCLDNETDKIDTMIAKASELRALLDERRSALITATVTGQHPVPEEF